MPAGDCEHYQRRYDGQVYLDIRQRKVEALALHAHAQEVYRRRSHQRGNQHSQDPALQEVNHRQSEHIEAGVAAEYGLYVVVAEGGGVGEAQEYLPARRHKPAEQQR